MPDVDIVEFKRNLRNQIISIYLQKGYGYTLRSIQHLIKTSTAKAKAAGDSSVGIQIRGECCELLLELQLWEFAKLNKLPWLVSKGLCLERTDKKRNKTTELDITLFTSGKIVLFESKYRQGNITLVDTCTIVPSWGSVTDVYKQNIMHLTNLKNHFSDAIVTLNGVKPFSIVLYVESLSRVTDTRSAEAKKLVPVVGPENINEHLASLAAIETKVWDMNKVRPIVTNLDSMSADNMKKHMEGVSKNESRTLRKKSKGSTK